MFRRIVFIGLGGSGGKTLRFLKRDLRHWLDAHDWPQERAIPAGFQFLHIDTPTVQDGVSMGGAEMLPDKEYLGLVGPGVSFAAVTAQLDSQVGILEEQTGWRVSPAALGVPIGAGAGAYRAVGRTIACAQIGELQGGIQGLINRINSPTAIADNSELWTLVKPGSQPGNVSDPLVVVISSLAGGTGAGLLMDVFDLLRTSQPTWGGDSFGLLYTPEVFRSIGGGMMGGVQPNSLAAISELLNGYYWHGVQNAFAVNPQDSDVGFRQSAIHSSAGVIGAISRSGPAYPFLIGSTNSSGIAFESDKQVFETIGSALVAWCVDAVVQDQLIAFTMTNWTSKATSNSSQADLLINQGDSTEMGLPAFNALGCARVSVGTRYLERYAAQRLARDAATYMAGFHMESDDAKAVIAKKGTTDPLLIARSIAQDKLLWFLKATGLREKGFDENDILDALKPAEYGGIWENAVDTAKRLADIGGKGSASEWLNSITDAVRIASEQFDTELTPLVEGKIESWVQSKPNQIIAVVEESIANYGFAVTVEMLDLVTDYLTNPTEGVCAELKGPNEHGAYSSWSSEAEWTKRAEAVLGTSRGNFSMQSNERVGEAVSSAMHYAAFVVDAKIREHAEGLLSEFASGFIKPLKRSLADAGFALERSLAVIVSWPTWSDGAPPPDCVPPKSEFTLIEPAKFDEVFVDNLARSVGGDPLELSVHRATARGAVISGGFLREMEERVGARKSEVRPLRAIQVSQPWIPSVAVLRSSHKARNDIFVSLLFSPSDLVSRATKWLRQQNTAFNDTLSSTLRTYTSGDNVFKSNIFVPESEYIARRQRFVGQLSAAVQASAPLVELDLALHPAIHPIRDFKRQFSSLPFNGHPLKDDVANLIRPYVTDAEGAGASVDSYFVNDLSIESIQIISTLSGAHHPFLFQSLLQPIAQRWATESATAAQRTSFWTKRRSRLPGESIPAPQEHIICMIRGWFTGRLFGLIDVPRNGENRPVLISQPWSISKDPTRFPYPALTETTNAGDELFSVLEALGIAFVNVGTMNNVTPLYPYVSLREMGRMREGVHILRYDTPNPLIRDWIATGSLSTEWEGNKKNEDDLRKGLSTKTHANLLGHETAEDRKDALLKLLEKVREDYSNDRNDFFNKGRINRSVLNGAPFWPGLRNTSNQPDLINRSLTSLIDGINSVRLSGVTGV